MRWWSKHVSWEAQYTTPSINKMITHQNSAVWPHFGVTSLAGSLVLLRFVTASYNRSVNCMRHLPLHYRGPHQLLAGLQDARGNATISGTPNCLNYF